MPDFRPALPHGAVEEVFPDVFVVTGSFGIGPVLARRNMTVVRSGTELTILNSVRLDDDGEKALAKLGTVKNLVRLGFFHGIDDPYYMARFTPHFWSGERMVPVNVDAKLRNELDERSSPVGTAFRFRGGTQDESAMVLPGGVLVTCDSVQNNVDTKGFSLLGAGMMRAVGLIGGLRIGPPWLKRITGGKTKIFAPEFERLLSLDWKHLLSGHGVPCRDTAKEQLRARTAITFGK